MILILDYGLGNLRAFANMLKDLDLAHEVSADPESIRKASHLILPGVGHFDAAMARLEGSGLVPLLEERVLGESVPLLGICVGMQMLARRSEEGERPGLGWIDGEVIRFPPQDQRTGKPLPVPHMGWNEVVPVSGCPLFDRMTETPRFYFLHSYHFRCAEPSDVLASADYGGPFPAAVGRRNIFGVQFHPEKSHGWGRELLAAFARIG